MLTPKFTTGNEIPKSEDVKDDTHDLADVEDKDDIKTATPASVLGLSRPLPGTKTQEQPAADANKAGESVGD